MIVFMYSAEPPSHPWRHQWLGAWATEIKVHCVIILDRWNNWCHELQEQEKVPGKKKNSKWCNQQKATMNYKKSFFFLQYKPLSHLSTSGSTPRDINTSMIFFITAPCRHGWTEACFPGKCGWSSIVTCVVFFLTEVCTINLQHWSDSRGFTKFYLASSHFLPSYEHGLGLHPPLQVQVAAASLTTR